MEVVFLQPFFETGDKLGVLSRAGVVCVYILVSFDY